MTKRQITVFILINW